MSYIYIIRDKDLNIEFVSTDRETLELYCRFNNLSEDYIETFKDSVAYKEKLKSALETFKKGYKFFEDEEGNFSCVPYLSLPKRIILKRKVRVIQNRAGLRPVL